jgi:acetylornithine deacetylase/succinyl-diaminopimelate desuccinylase-like protein
VVPAKSEDWSHAPFGADVADGYVWGRGAVDMKNTTAIQMVAMSVIARSGIQLKRDLLLAGMAGEERDPQNGAIFLAEEHPDWVRAEYALNESGGEALVIGGRRFYTFQVAQKMSLVFRMIGRGKAGHSSVPYAEGAISQLAAGILSLKTHPLPHHVIPTTRRFFQALAAGATDPALKAALLDMLDPEREPAAVERLGLSEYQTRMFSAMLRNIAEITIVNAGYKANVMPAEAEATVAARPLPGITREQLIAEVTAAAGDTVEIIPERWCPGMEFNLPDDDPLFQAASYAIRRHDPEGILVPYLSCGGTDAPFLEPLGVKAIGFTPMRPERAGLVLELAHAADERVAVDNLGFGVRVLLDTICRLNGVENPIV